MEKRFLHIISIFMIVMCAVVVNAVSTAAVGSISASSSPSGATVFVDNVNSGVTPVTVSNIAAGSHSVRLTLSGYQDYVTSVFVNDGQTTSVSATLTPVSATGTGFISVSSSPSGANVYVDNVFKGVTPVTVSNVAVGSHAVKLTMGGYQDYVTSVFVNDGQTTSVSATLTTAVSNPGSGSFSALPVTIEKTTVNGDDLIAGDTNYLSLTRGDNLDVKVRLSGFGNDSNVEVQAFISGYEYSRQNPISDVTSTFDVKAGVTYVKKLSLSVPAIADTDNYLLRVLVTDRSGREVIHSRRGPGQRLSSSVHR